MRIGDGNNKVLTRDDLGEASREKSLSISILAASAVITIHKLKGLILAQNERWRRGLGMQVVRE